MPLPYDPTNWYWFITGSTQQVYSSKVGDYVPLTDPTYVAWAANGTPAPVLTTEAELGAMLAPFYPFVTRPVPQGVLDSYQQDQANDIFRNKLTKVLFNMFNDIRVLKGQQPPTVAQAKAAFKGQM